MTPKSAPRSSFGLTEGESASFSRASLSAIAFSLRACPLCTFLPMRGWLPRCLRGEKLPLLLGLRLVVGLSSPVNRFMSSRCCSIFLRQRNVVLVFSVEFNSHDLSTHSELSAIVNRETCEKMSSRVVFEQGEPRRTLTQKILFMPKQSKNFPSTRPANEKDSNNQRKKYQKKPMSDSFFRLSADDKTNQVNEPKPKFKPRGDVAHGRPRAGDPNPKHQQRAFAPRAHNETRNFKNNNFSHQPYSTSHARKPLNDSDSTRNAQSLPPQRFDPYAKARQQFEAKVQQQADERAERERQRELAKQKQVQKFQKAKVDWL